MNKHEKINYVEFSAKDIEKAKAFFIKAFGWSFVDYGPEYAESEFIKAIDYYEDCEIDLGLRFSEEVYATIERACNFPLAWEKIDSKTHRFLTDKFPYGILYRIHEDHIRIMAIMNLHRMPGYWLKRK